MLNRLEDNIMRLPRRKFVHLTARVISLAAVSRFAWGQAYPTRPITIIVSFVAGGAGDTIARILAERMRASLGQPVIIENVSGASGSLGVSRVARAKPDGYTLSFGNWATHVLNGAVLSLQYDVLKDFEPIALLVTESMLIVGRKTLPANNLKELIGWLRANPSQASAGTNGAGSVPHVVGVLFQKETGTRFQFVPYRGAGPAMQDLVAGQIDLMIDLSATSLPQSRAGTIKTYAVTAKRRLTAAPDIPTVDEAPAWVLRFELARTVGTEGDTEYDHCQAQQGRRRHLSRSSGTSAACRPRSGNSRARTADAGGPRRVAEGRNREMVANCQVGEHQAGVSPPADDR
jgi:tripartite-type tricarboxylate transporter receptor subunit TctC